MLLAVVADDAGLRVGQLAAARQLQEQGGADALERDSAGTDDSAAFADCSPGGTIKVIPELLDRRMRRAPFFLEGFDFDIAEASRRSTPPQSRAFG